MRGQSFMLSIPYLPLKHPLMIPLKLNLSNAHFYRIREEGGSGHGAVIL